MNIKRFNSLLEDMKGCLVAAKNQELDLHNAATSEKWVYDFKFKKAKYLVDTLKKYYLEVQTFGPLFETIKQYNIGKELEINKVMVNIRLLNDFYSQADKGLAIIEEIQRFVKTFTFPEEEVKQEVVQRVEKKIEFVVPPLPEEIGENISADILEMRKCFDSGCYRSCIILCGRILETVLHRKHYDVTGIDALEKTPGIGLGKLIAKLRENNIDLDPAITQQIHLINQARIFSVHTKQTVFNPSMNQAHAIILYTLDILGKMF